VEIVPAGRVPLDCLVTRDGAAGLDAWGDTDSCRLIQCNFIKRRRADFVTRTDGALNRPASRIGRTCVGSMVIGRVHCVGNLYDGQR
jgi:hypothetical protein